MADRLPVVVNYSQEERVQSIIRQLSELVVTLVLLGFAWSVKQSAGSGELVGGIVGVVATYWINKGTSSATTRGLQEVTARALNGPLTAVSETNLHQSNQVERLTQELNNMKVLVAGLQYQRTQSDKQSDTPQPVQVVGQPVEVTVMKPSKP